MLKKMYDSFCSLNLGLWLIGLVMAFLAAGSFSRGASEQAGLNEIPLLLWLREAPLSFSWWLWIVVALLAILVLNTLACSIESLRKGRNIAPHLMHAGFLFIVAAHLFSAYGGFKQRLEVVQGGRLYYPDGENIVMERISATGGPMGMMTAYSATLREANGKVTEVSPNHPFFHKGYGVYLKEVGMMQQPVALVEVHREPGAIPALIGAVVFTVGNLMLLRSRKGDKGRKA